MLELHSDIKSKLDHFIENRCIPHIVFYGPSGSGKRTLVNEFIDKIYNDDKANIKEYVMFVDCARGKGIRFIRDELKFFAHTHMEIKAGCPFKTILLSNADKLTNDAQSALRRVIEVFSHNTRFFIIVDDKFKLLKPILSRFSDIYIPEPIINGKPWNLHHYGIQSCLDSDSHKSNIDRRLKIIINRHLKVNVSVNNNNNNSQCTQLCHQTIKQLVNECYESGISSVDLLRYIEKPSCKIDLRDKTRIIIFFNKIKKQYRCERLLMYTMFYTMFIRSNYNVEYVGFM